MALPRRPAVGGILHHATAAASEDVISALQLLASKRKQSSEKAAQQQRHASQPPLSGRSGATGVHTDSVRKRDIAPSDMRHGENARVVPETIAPAPRQDSYLPQVPPLGGMPTHVAPHAEVVSPPRGAFDDDIVPEPAAPALKLVASLPFVAPEPPRLPVPQQLTPQSRGVDASAATLLTLRPDAPRAPLALPPPPSRTSAAPPEPPRITPWPVAAVQATLLAPMDASSGRKLMSAVKDLKTRHSLFRREVARMLQSSSSALDLLAEQVVRTTRRVVEHGAQGA